MGRDKSFKLRDWAVQAEMHHDNDPTRPLQDMDRYRIALEYTAYHAGADVDALRCESQTVVLQQLDPRLGALGIRDGVHDSGAYGARTLLYAALRIQADTDASRDNIAFAEEMLRREYLRSDNITPGEADSFIADDRRRLEDAAANQKMLAAFGHKPPPDPWLREQRADGALPNLQLYATQQRWYTPHFDPEENDWRPIRFTENDYRSILQMLAERAGTPGMVEDALGYAQSPGPTALLYAAVRTKTDRDADNSDDNIAFARMLLRAEYQDARGIEWFQSEYLIEQEQRNIENALAGKKITGMGRS